MTKILSDKYPLLLILHLARLSSSCDLVMCVRTHHIPPLEGAKIRSKGLLIAKIFCQK